jgi:hypothetical protein
VFSVTVGRLKEKNVNKLPELIRQMEVFDLNSEIEQVFDKNNYDLHYVTYPAPIAVVEPR